MKLENLKFNDKINNIMIKIMTCDKYDRGGSLLFRSNSEILSDGVENLGSFFIHEL